MKKVLFALVATFIFGCGKEPEQPIVSYPDDQHRIDFNDFFVNIETKVRFDDKWVIASGSGIAIRFDGKLYIHTAAHVIKHAEDQEVQWIRVRFPNQTSVKEAKLVYWEPLYYPDKILWIIRFENGQTKELIDPSFDDVLQAIIMGRSAVVQIDKGPMPSLDRAILELME